MTIEIFPTEDVRKADHDRRREIDIELIRTVESAIDRAIAAGVADYRLQELLISRAMRSPLLNTNPLRDGQDLKQVDRDLYFLEELKRRVDGMVRMYRNGRTRMTGSPIINYDHLDWRRLGDFIRF